MFSEFPCVRQNDESDCGPAVLATVALHHRIPIGLQQMRDLAGTDKVGTNLLGLVQAAEKLGFTANAVKGPYEGLPRVPLPAIAHVRTEEGLGHFVVLHRATSRGVVVADPARGVEKLSREEFCRRWTGYLLIIVPGEATRPTGRPAAPVGPWRRFLGLLGAHTPVLAEAFVCALLMTLLGSAPPTSCSTWSTRSWSGNERLLLNALGIGMVLIVIFKTLFGMLRQYLVAYVGRKVDLALIAGYARHILRCRCPSSRCARSARSCPASTTPSKVREAISGTTADGRRGRDARGHPGGGPLVVRLPPGSGGDGVRARTPAERAGPPPGGAATVARGDGGGRRLSAHLVEDVSGVETIKAFGAERDRAEEGEGRLVRLVQALFSLQKLAMSMSSHGDIRDRPGRGRDPLVRRPPGHGRGADDRPVDVLLHPAGLPARPACSGWPR